MKDERRKEIEYVNQHRLNAQSGGLFKQRQKANNNITNQHLEIENISISGYPGKTKKQRDTSRY